MKAANSLVDLFRASGDADVLKVQQAARTQLIADNPLFIDVPDSIHPSQAAALAFLSARDALAIIKRTFGAQKPWLFTCIAATHPHLSHALQALHEGGHPKNSEHQRLTQLHSSTEQLVQHIIKACSKEPLSPAPYAAIATFYAIGAAQKALEAEQDPKSIKRHKGQAQFYALQAMTHSISAFGAIGWKEHRSELAFRSLLASRKQLLSRVKALTFHTWATPEMGWSEEKLSATERTPDDVTSDQNLVALLGDQDFQQSGTKEKIDRLLKSSAGKARKEWGRLLGSSKIESSSQGKLIDDVGDLEVRTLSNDKGRFMPLWFQGIGGTEDKPSVPGVEYLLDTSTYPVVKIVIRVFNPSEESLLMGVKRFTDGLDRFGIVESEIVRI